MTSDIIHTTQKPQWYTLSRKRSTGALLIKNYKRLNPKAFQFFNFIGFAVAA